MRSTPPRRVGGSGEVTLIQTGDIRGHLVPRPNLRSNAITYRGHGIEGGVARMYTVIKVLRATDPATGTVRPLKRVLPTYSIKQVGL